MSVNGFKWFEKTSQFNEDFTESYNEESNEGYFLEVDAELPEKLYELHNDLPFLTERMKTGKVEKFVITLRHKKQYVIHIRNLNKY